MIPPTQVLLTPQAYRGWFRKLALRVLGDTSAAVGNPNPERICTSHVERQNLNIAETLREVSDPCVLLQENDDYPFGCDFNHSARSMKLPSVTIRSPTLKPSSTG